MELRRALPALVLLAYAVAFGIAAFGASTPAFDDHPGQVYRLWHAITHGIGPASWNPGWWAGYPELQFYPPGFFHLGVGLHLLSLGTLSLTATYSVLLWLAWILPGASTYAALTRLLGNGWLALPGAFVVLTLSAGVASGVEGGVRWGMLPARLAWGLLPLLMLAVGRGLASGPGAAGPAAVMAPLVAAIVVTHPAHAPAAVVLVVLGALACRADRGRRLAHATLVLGLAGGLSAFWTVPLVGRLEHTRALAWGRLDLPGEPVLLGLLALAALALRFRREHSHPRSAIITKDAAAVVAFWPWAAGSVVAVDALVLEPLGLRWLPPDRVVDGAWMAVVLAAGFAGGRLLERVAMQRGVPIPALALTAVAAAAVISLPGQALSLWPRTAEWPTYEATSRGLRLDDLWAALRRAPTGRVLFVRSGVPLVFGSEWWRPHTHVTALAPVHAGRAIVHGTFTHPSPVAALVYRGSPESGPLALLAERLDGRSLFGVPLDALQARDLNAHADRLGIAVVVVLDEDVPRLRALEGNSQFARGRVVGPFALYERRTPVVLPERIDDHRWRFAAEGPAGAWVTARTTYYPLWRAEREGRVLETRRGPAWDLEVLLDAGRGPIDLVYASGRLETGGVVVSLAAMLAWLGWCWRASRPVGS